MSTFGLSRTPTFGRRQGTFTGGYQPPQIPLAPQAPTFQPGTSFGFAPPSSATRFRPPRPQFNFNQMPKDLVKRTFNDFLRDAFPGPSQQVFGPPDARVGSKDAWRSGGFDSRGIYDPVTDIRENDINIWDVLNSDAGGDILNQMMASLFPQTDPNFVARYGPRATGAGYQTPSMDELMRAIADLFQGDREPYDIYGGR